MRRPQPPRFWLSLFRKTCRADFREELEGDLIELFEATALESPSRARMQFRKEVLKLIRPRLLQSFQFPTLRFMLYRNYLKTAIRNAKAYKNYTLINLMGLVVGITSSLFISLWVEDETGKDQYHSNIERIFSIKRNLTQSGGTTITSGYIPNPMVQVLLTEYPEVESVVEISWPINSLIGLDQKVTMESGRMVSANFFSVFSFPLLVGDPENILKDPHAIAISSTLAGKLAVNPQTLMGQTLKLDNESSVTVRGIFKDVGTESSMQFDWVTSNVNYKKANDWLKSWENGGFNLHVLLKDSNGFPLVNQRVGDEIERHTERVSGETLWLQHYGNGYLFNNYEEGKVNGGRIDYVRILRWVALFVLIIACINFMNLTTARAARRAREIGLRKVLGAHRAMITGQFYFEALLYAVTAVLLSIMFVALLMPFFNDLVDKDLVFRLTPLKITYTVLLVAFIALLSGSYPAIRLSVLTQLNALKGTQHLSPVDHRIRQGMVVFQVAVSFLLLIGALVVSNQLNYLLNKDTGLDRTNVLATTIEGALDGKFNTYRQELLQLPGVIGVTGASGNPVAYRRSTSSAKWEGQEADTPYELGVLLVAENFLDMLSIEVVDGNGFPSELKGGQHHYVVNQAAVGIMGFEDPIGKQLSIWGMEGRIVGVVEDYATQSLHKQVGPLIIKQEPENIEVALVKTEGNVGEIIAGIDALTREMNPGYPFIYEFLDETYAAHYETEKVMSRLSNVFVIISLVISGMGLLGLSAYNTERRVKEIGIRKVHGASTWQLTMLLSRQHFLLMIVAFVFTVPVSMYFLDDWLNDFAFRILITPKIFMAAAFIMTVMGVATVGLRSFWASRQNPVDSLRSE